MPGFERPLERASREAAAALVRAGRELREARLGRGLSLRSVADAIGISASEGSRIERGHAPKVPYTTLARYAAAVGLELPLRTFPGLRPIRDAAHVALLADFRSRLHRSLRWAVEVPLPNPGDQRAWDGFITGSGWTYGVEAETAFSDAQATLRRLTLKTRDGGVDGVILVLPGTRRTLEAVRAARPELAASSRFLAGEPLSSSRPAPTRADLPWWSCHRVRDGSSRRRIRHRSSCRPAVDLDVQNGPSLCT